MPENNSSNKSGSPKGTYEEWALFYARERAWPVFRLAPFSKKPLKDSQGLLDATTNESKIRQWWEETPDANIGVRMGVTCFATDEDPRHGSEETIEHLFHQHGRLPDTLTAITPNGGRHRFWSQPDQAVIGTRAPARDDWPGVDVRGEGGYVAVHPSIVQNEKGEWKRYMWDGMAGENEAILPAPAWLVEALTAAAASANGHAPFELPEGKIKWGTQKHTLFRLGASMRAKGCEYDEIVEAMWTVNQNRCERPGPRKNIEREARWICEHYEKGVPIRDMPPGPAHEDWPTAEPPPDPVREHAVASYSADCAEPEAVIEPILYPGLTILGGRPKAGKSWLALQMGIALVNEDIKFGGYLKIRKRCRCLYVSLEDRRPQLKKRLRHLVPDASYLEGLDLMYELAPLLSGGADQLDKTLLSDPVSVLIVDSLLAAAQQSDRKDKDIMQADYNIIRVLRELAWKHQLALTLIAHTRKAPGDFLDMIQGTTGTTAAADAIWVLKRTPEGKATLEVTGREIPSNVFGLERAEDSPAWVITGEGDEITQSDARQNIIQLLRDKCGPTGRKDKKPSPGLKPSDISRELRMPISTVNRLLAALCEIGLVVKTGYGSYNLPGQNEPPEAYDR